MFRELITPRKIRRPMGAHWHFVNFLSTLIGPAMIYIWARNVEKKRNKHYEEKEKERIMKPEILTNSQQNSIESAIEASKVTEAKTESSKLLQLEKRISTLEEKERARDLELMAKRLYQVAVAESSSNSNVLSNQTPSQERRPEWGWSLFSWNSDWYQFWKWR
uniref:Uncharacterized protein n=1 Tax=Aplanochytrium stocchinoi TaxID=215587 RepID=A0A7S3PCR3_9STRA